MPQNPGTDRVLEALQELGGEGCGFVEAEAGGGIGWVLIRIFTDTLEEPVHDVRPAPAIPKVAPAVSYLRGQNRKERVPQLGDVPREGCCNKAVQTFPLHNPGNPLSKNRVPL